MRTSRRETIFVFFIFSLRSFSDLRKLDCRLSSEQKAKLVYAKRATHRKFAYLCYFKPKGYVMA